MARALLLASALLLSCSTAGAQTGPPSNPIPLHGATGVFVAGPLTWTPVPGAVSYDLHLGTSESNLTFAATGIPQHTTLVSFTPPSLSTNTVYYWRVTTHGPANTIAGPVWSFTTAASAPKSWADWLMSVGLLGLLAAAVKYVSDRASRGTDVLLKLEDEFHKKAEKGRGLIDFDERYATTKLAFARARDGRGDLTDIDNLLRFYVVLYAVRRAHQVPDRSLSIAYRFWLSHYYWKDRKELREYINEEFPTLRRWLLADLSAWTRFASNPLSPWWRSFFTPEHFTTRDKLLLTRAELDTRPEDAAPARDLRVLVLTGAGISADSGIPTFRGAEGLWRSEDAKELATHRAFRRRARDVWEFYRERRAAVRRARPNAAHEAITQLGLRVPNFLLVTQNVDDLHGRTAWQGRTLSREHIVQIHGDILSSRCESCGFATPCEQCGFTRGDAETDLPAVPPCPRCGAALRPGVVWFDEELDPRDEHRVEDFLKRGPCDVTLVIGTSAGFDYIIDWAVRSVGTTGQLIEINPEETPLSAKAARTIRERASVAVPKVVDELLRSAGVKSAS
jgi:NAD-dependent deacetylase